MTDFRTKLLDFICRRLRMPRYSLFRDYSPVDYARTLSDTPDKVHVFVLHPTINEDAYADLFRQMCTDRGIMLDSTIIFLKNDFNQIRTLDPDEVGILKEMAFSGRPQKAGIAKSRGNNQ